MFTYSQLNTREVAEFEIVMQTRYADGGTWTTFENSPSPTGVEVVNLIWAFLSLIRDNAITN